MDGEIHVGAHPAQRAPHCPYCHADIASADADVWTCPRCSTRHHDACARENGRCTLLGCGAPHERPLRHTEPSGPRADGQLHGGPVVGIRTGPVEREPANWADPLDRAAEKLRLATMVPLFVGMALLGASERVGTVVLVGSAVLFAVSIALASLASVIRFFEEEENAPLKAVSLGLLFPGLGAVATTWAFLPFFGHPINPPLAWMSVLVAAAGLILTILAFKLDGP
jgi:hypothetical protein